MTATFKDPTQAVDMGLLGIAVLRARPRRGQQEDSQIASTVSTGPVAEDRVLVAQ